MHVDGRLPVHRGREVLLGHGGDRRIARDQHAHDAPQRLDAQGERGDVEQEHVRDPARQDVRLHGGAEGHHLVGIELAVRRLPEELLDTTPHERHPGRPSHEHDLAHLIGRESRVLEGKATGAERLVHEGCDQALQLGPRDLAAVGEALERDGEGGPLLGRQPALGGFRAETQLLHGLRIAREVLAMDGLDVGEQPLDQGAIEVVAAQMRVAVGGQDFEDPVLDAENGDVEGAAAQVVDGDQALGELLQAIGERGRRGLVDDPQRLEPRDARGVLGRLALRIVEVCGHGDDRLVHGLGLLLQRAQDLGGHLGRRHLAVAHADPHHLVARRDLEGHVARLFPHILAAPAHEALDGVDGPRRIPRELPPRGLPDHDARGRIGDHGGQEPAPFRVRDDARDPGRVHVGDQAIGGAEVNADDARHASLRPLPRPGPGPR